MAITKLDILENMRKVLSSPARFNQGYYAATANGDSCEAYDDYAVCWCIQGARRKVTAEMGLPDGRVLSWSDLDEYALDIFGEQWNEDGRIVVNSVTREHAFRTEEGYLRDPSVHVNDALGYEAVLKVIDAAIEKEKARWNTAPTP